MNKKPIVPAPFRPESFAPVISEQMPINVNIHIECETLPEVIAHLTVLRKTLKKTLNKAEYENSEEFTVSDSNCYGTHYAQINQEV